MNWLEYLTLHSIFSSVFFTLKILFIIFAVKFVFFNFGSIFYFFSKILGFFFERGAFFIFRKNNKKKSIPNSKLEDAENGEYLDILKRIGVIYNDFELLEKIVSLDSNKESKETKRELLNLLDKKIKLRYSDPNFSQLWSGTVENLLESQDISNVHDRKHYIYNISENPIYYANCRES